MVFKGKECIALLRWFDPKVIVIRSHFKFTATQTIQQTVVLNKFLKNKNQKILNKLIDNMPNIVSKGSANRKEIDAKGSEKRLITRRMTVLNKLLMQCISDVLSTEQIGHNFQDLEVRVTQVKVNQRCTSANIYWTSKHESTEEVAKRLDQLKGQLHQHLTERNLMNSIPWLQFVLDLDESHSQLVDDILKKCDFGPDFKPSDSTLLETPYEKMSRSDDKPKHKKSEEQNQNPNVYEFVKMQKPIDMQMNCLGLEYESLINQVLLNLSKSRAQHRHFNAVADPLPPPDWSTPLPNPPPNQESDAVYNTEQRIKAMKTFLVENRKRREKLSRIKKRQTILNEMKVKTYLDQAFEGYDINDQQLEEEFKHDFEESIDYSNDSNVK